MSSPAMLPLLPSVLLGSLGCLLFYVVSFYYKVSRFPKGPTPLPFLGNILLFRTPKGVHEIFNELSAKYSDLYTIYMGPKPIIVISDSKLGVECMRKVAFAGRPDYGITRFMFPENSIDVFFGDYSREWEVLKKVSHEAIKKYTRSARHPFVVSRVVDQLFDRKDPSGKRKEIEALEDLTLTLNAILASAAFGKEYSFEDPEFLSWKKSMQSNGSRGGKLLLVSFVPVFKYVFRDMWNNFKESKDFQRNFVKQRYEEALQSFDGTTVSTFCQAVISAQREAESEDREIAKFMTINNLMNVVFDLFFAGTDTTKNTLAWIFLFVCKNQEMQERMRQEIIRVVGDKNTIPQPEHKDDCHYTMAFIHEVMRFRTITPNGVPHKTTIDTVVAGHSIPKGTIVLHPYHKALHDPEAWSSPEVFNPDRFLVDGQFSKQSNACFISFGVGRRSCPGNQLALLTMFLVIARLMQNVHAAGGKFSIEDKTVGIDGQKIAAAWISNKYTMRVIQ